jgi:preprotein translocase SecE subunit
LEAVVAEAKKKARIVKKSETMRERTVKQQGEQKPRRIRRVSNQAKRPLKAASKFGRREYYLPLPDNRFGRFLNKKYHIIPGFLRNAWAEVRQVVWPSRRETLKLTLAVIIFALVFGTAIWLVDYGIEKLFRTIIL